MQAHLQRCKQFPAHSKDASDFAVFYSCIFGVGTVYDYKENAIAPGPEKLWRQIERRLVDKGWILYISYRIPEFRILKCN